MPRDRVEPATNAGHGSPWWTPVAVAVAFLSVLPVPRHPASVRDVGRALALFPLVGAALGGSVGVAGLALDRFLPPAVVSALLVGLGVIVTGALHLDGMMDTADGLFGGRNPERRLAIMRDSRVGAYGVVAGVLTLLVPYATLAELSGLERLAALAVAWGLGRWAMVLAIHVFTAARPDGLGASVRSAAGRAPLTIGTGLSLGVLYFGAFGAIGLGLTAALVLLGGRFMARRVGGLTGDSYGALAVVTETALLCLAVALHGAGGAR